MSRTLSRRLLTQSNPSHLPDLAIKRASQCIRTFSQTRTRNAKETIDLVTPRESEVLKQADSPASSSPASASTPAPKLDRFSYGQSSTSSPSLNPSSRIAPSAMSNLGTLASMLDQNNQDRNASRRNAAYDSLSLFPSSSSSPEGEPRQAHQLHVYAHKHNCHITLWGPPKAVRMNKKKDKDAFNGGAILSMSVGQLGFRHSGRKHYDSAFQLASYVFARMSEAGVSQDITDLELYLRGFGAGREAVTKALLGSEGKLLRGKVRKVADTTRLKFGGTRSPKPRRLG